MSSFCSKWQYPQVIDFNLITINYYKTLNAVSYKEEIINI